MSGMKKAAVDCESEGQRHTSHQTGLLDFKPEPGGRPRAKGAIARVHLALKNSIAAASGDGQSRSRSTVSSAAPPFGFGLLNIG
jgi:hypothetical protein